MFKRKKLFKIDEINFLKALYNNIYFKNKKLSKVVYENGFVSVLSPAFLIYIQRALFKKLKKKYIIWGFYFMHMVLLNMQFKIDNITHKYII